MSQKYFTKLNYSLGNEDTQMELSMLEKLGSEGHKPEHIVAVAGSGGRSLPLGIYAQKKLTCVDLSSCQIYLTKLRLATYRDLSFEEFRRFWAYLEEDTSSAVEQDAKDRKEIYHKLKIDGETKKYFDLYFEENNFSSLLYDGKWEKTFSTLSKILRKLLGEKGMKIMECRDLKEQVQYFENEFPKKRWALVLFLLGNKSVFNALLYRGDFIKKNVKEGHFIYYWNAFERLFKTRLARTSFFLELCFYGKVKHKLGVPVEASEEIFFKLQERLRSGLEVEVLQGNILDILSNQKNVDFVSLSDVPSYFSGETEKNFMNIIGPGLSKDCVVVNRYYLREAKAQTQSYKEITNHFSMQIGEEGVQMYRPQILQKI